MNSNVKACYWISPRQKIVRLKADLKKNLKEEKAVDRWTPIPLVTHVPGLDSPD
jgi:hypothetical protein